MGKVKLLFILTFLLLLSTGCSEQEDKEQNGVEDAKTFLNAYYNVSYEESIKIMDKVTNPLAEQVKDNIEENPTADVHYRVGELYPKSFEPFFTKEGYNRALKNGMFSLLPQLAIKKHANYKLESLKQISYERKKGYSEYKYEAKVSEIIKGKTKEYTDNVQFYMVEDKGKWRISNLRILDSEYMK
ncbi:hypothetical protein ACIQ4I_01600 [Rummeliibacillus sp. NPDC094406]|uniref:hypothetical protein n=1 Tax=Rummeliibacillus sp. NPDC094406 TaxID=3364511 RepID=UPI0037F8905B